MFEHKVSWLKEEDLPLYFGLIKVTRRNGGSETDAVLIT